MSEPLRIGDRVKLSAEGLRLCSPRCRYRVGVIAAVRPDGSFRVHWDGNRRADSLGRRREWLEASP